jgi:hypothetical protein
MPVLVAANINVHMVTTMKLAIGRSGCKVRADDACGLELVATVSEV